VERWRLHQRLAYAPLPIWFNGDVLNFLSLPVATRRLTRIEDRTQGVACAGPFERKKQRYEDEPAPALHEFSLRACTGAFQREDVRVPVCGAVLELRDPKQPSRVVLVKHGVALDTSPALRLPGAHCVLSAQGLRLDLSTLRVVEDARFEEMLARLEGEVRKFYHDLVPAFDQEMRTRGPSLGQGVKVALWLLLMIVVVVGFVACLAGGEGAALAGCSWTGDGCGSPGAERDVVREQVQEILRNY